MRRAIAVTLALASMAVSGFGQDMAEAARRERERRKKAKESGQTATVVTSDELTATKGELANDPGAPAPSPRPVAGAKTAGRAPRSESAVPDSDAERREAEQEWRSRAAAARQLVADWQERYDYWSSLHLDWGHYFVDENGKKLVSSPENLQKLIARAKVQLDAAKQAVQDLEDSARRQNVPPGWLR